MYYNAYLISLRHRVLEIADPQILIVTVENPPDFISRIPDTRRNIKQPLHTKFEQKSLLHLKSAHE